MMFGCLAQRGRSWVEQEDHRMNCDSDIAKEFDAHMKTTTLGTCQCHSSVCVCQHDCVVFVVVAVVSFSFQSSNDSVWEDSSE